MFIALQAHNYAKHLHLVQQYYRLRKRVFCDLLQWDCTPTGDEERDYYDTLGPVYLLWCSSDMAVLYGGMRLMPTTGPTLLYDVFRRTFPNAAELSAPGIWEGTRMCIHEANLKRDHPDIEPGRAFGLMLLALCECAMAHGIHTMISNYEPHLKRVYQRAGAVVDELGRADGYGNRPVCCGSFDVSAEIHARMQAAMEVDIPLYRRPPLHNAEVMNKHNIAA
ncbi:acyl-homoserine-lactone synthase [Mesorhizobium retamae]|uniref:Acyl-homoserine-lactone synthase n=1 Tax=Mesorhizobium retamae TaxID=2912854 RepID=A0ABS9QPD9_9HYPH|nr:acyl-homoserine-lactone synthase [Mesorhizobium sp. IRAMC:0171]MCG7509320.1 N-acyl-L-homoserine lactone (AHL) synthase [Mesorhizobium sp. IRAMC:0171]